MTSTDKLELGLQQDPAYRKDHPPPSQIPGSELPTGSGRLPEIPLARQDRTQPTTPPPASTVPGRSRRTGRVWPTPVRRRRGDGRNSEDMKGSS